MLLDRNGPNDNKLYKGCVEYYINTIFDLFGIYSLVLVII